MESNKSKVILTMTCSKRLHLFKKVLPSFKNHCLDPEFIAKILICDDSSSEEDRKEMEILAKELFPTTNIEFKYFNEIPTKYRHAHIMQHWYEYIAGFGYVFHLEDDRIMNSDFSLKEMIDLLENDSQVATVNIAQTKRDFPQEFLNEYNLDINYPKNEDYWVWPYVKTKECGEALFYDSVRCEEGSKEYGINYFEYFINYAGFGLQPCLMHVDRIRSLETFELVDSLEASFGKKYSEKYITICYKQSKSTHVGAVWFKETSAYDMNESLR
jgi:hypothetical protein